MIKRFIKKYRPLYLQYKTTILYIFFGGITTVVGIGFFALFYYIFGLGTLAANTLSWILAVLTAFVTNKLFVFESKSFDPHVLWKELASFLVARVLSLILDNGIMLVFVDMLGLNAMLMKIIANILVLIFNFAASKLFIFKKKAVEIHEPEEEKHPMNETIQNILARRSIRRFQTAPVDRSLLEAIVEAGTYAASGMNGQPWFFSVVSNQTLISDIVSAYKDSIKDSDDPGLRERAADPLFHNFYHAPAVIIVSGLAGSRFQVYDCAGATQNMAVAAQSLGLGSCYIVNFLPAFSGEDAETFKNTLHIPDGYEPVASLALGYPQEPLPQSPARKEDACAFIS